MYRDLAGLRVPAAPKFVATYRWPAPGFSFAKVGLSSTPLVLATAVGPLRVPPTGAYIRTADSNGANKVEAPYKIHAVRDCSVKQYSFDRTTRVEFPIKEMSQRSASGLTFRYIKATAPTRGS